MDRKDLIAKYHGVLHLMFNSGEKGDLNELLDKLIYMVRKHFGDLLDTEGEDHYEGIPEPFDWDDARRDFAELFSNKELVVDVLEG